MHADHAIKLREIAHRIAHDVAASARGEVNIYEADAFLCPNCWVRQGAKSQLYWVGREEEGDRLRCDACHGEFVA